MWRDTGMKAEIVFGVDGRVAIFLLIFILHIAMWTFLVFAGITVFFFAISRAGYTFDSALARARTWIIGSSRTKWSSWEYNTRAALPEDSLY